jgi:hypothetical protein
MQNIKQLVVIYLAISFSNLLACDVCGNYLGITPYDNKSGISILHRYRVFNGYRNYQAQSHFFPPSAYKMTHGDPTLDSLKTANHNYSSKDFESYKIIELRFKYYVSNRFELNAFVPVLNNKSKTDNNYRQCTGLGDISLNAGYHILNPKADKPVRHKLILGLGIKLPSGNFYVHDSNSDRLPFEMQPGTGSLDYFTYINYVVMTKKIGMNMNMNVKINGTNKFKEQWSNSANNFLSVFYKLALKDFLFYPSLQANYEMSKGLYVNNDLQENTSIKSLMIGPGFDIYYKSFSVNTSWQFTVSEKVNSGSLKSAGRLSIGLNYSFGKREKS